MTPTAFCSRCRSPLTGGACPLCMMEDIALASPIGGRPLWEDLGETEDLFEVIDGFAVLRPLGAGGMGQVFLARQLSTGREVAVKLLRATVSVARFRQEVATLAKLDHPGVVPVLHAGEHKGRPYYAMEYVAGANLTDRMRLRGFSPREAVGVIVSVARAIQHAHDRGILHRDIKPQNILMTIDGVARVTDFGLARWMDADAETLTTTGLRLGTPAYMAPEQVSGDRGRQGAATDVYGLGATLYHLLAGVAPFRGEHVDQVYHQILDGEPVGVRLLNEKVDRDLESVVQACLEKDPARRYATAGLLAEDLERWLSGEPVRRRPTGALGRALKWCRRKPAVAGLLALLACSVGVGFWVSESQRRKAEELTRTRGLELYGSDMSLAWEAFRAGDLGRVRGLLDAHLPRAGEEEIRGFEWHHLSGLTQGDPCEVVAHGSNVLGVALSPDGVWMASGSIDGQLKMRRTAGGGDRTMNFAPEKLASLAFSPDSGELAVTVVNPDPGRSRVVRVAVADGTVRGEVPGLAYHVAYVPGTDWIATSAAHRVYADQNAPLRLWSVGRAAEVPGIEVMVSRFAFSADGRLLATFEFAEDKQPGRVTLWEREGWKRLRSWQTLPRISGLAFSGDGGWLAGTGFNGTVLAWAVADPSVELAARVVEDGTAYRVGFVGSGEPLLATVSSQAVDLWRLDRTERRLARVRTLRGHGAEVTTLSTQPGQEWLVSGANDKTARLWKGEEASPMAMVIPINPRGASFPVRFSGDGRIFVCADTNGIVARKWPGEAEAGRSPELLDPMFVNEDGTEWKAMLYEDPSASVVTWSAKQSRRLSEVRLEHWHEGTNYVWLEPSRDGRWLAATRMDTQVDLFSMETGSMRPLMGHRLPVTYSAGFSADSGLLATPGNDGTVRVWDVASGRALRVFEDTARVFCVRFSPDGTRLAAAGNSGETVVWRVADGRVEARLPRTGTDMWVDFSPDGRTLAKYSGAKVQLFQVGTWRPLFDLPGLGSGFSRMGFDPRAAGLWVAPTERPEVRVWKGR